jgi:hypothetical protein
VYSGGPIWATSPGGGLFTLLKTSTNGAPAPFAFAIPGAISAGTPALMTTALAPPWTAVLIAASQPVGVPCPNTTLPLQPIAFAASTTPCAERCGSGAGTL